jgi:hypothetical protein
MKAKAFDRKFDSGEKIVDQLDLSKARRVEADAKRVNVDFPAWMMDSPRPRSAPARCNTTVAH